MLKDSKVLNYEEGRSEGTFPFLLARLSEKGMLQQIPLPTVPHDTQTFGVLLFPQKSQDRNPGSFFY